MSIPKKRNLKNTLKKFVGLGVINTILDFALFNIIRVITHTPSSDESKIVLINILSATTVAIFSFFVSKKYVFSHNATKNHMIIPFIATNLFGIFVLQSLVISIVLGPLHPTGEFFQEIAVNWHLPLLQNFTINFYVSNIAKVCATAVTLVWNFVMYNYVIFKHAPIDTETPSEE